MAATECECGNPKPRSADACTECVALEVSLGLRRASRGARPSVKAKPNTPAYQRERRAALARAGRCSCCGARPAEHPLKSCTVCLARGRKAAPAPAPCPQAPDEPADQTARLQHAERMAEPTCSYRSCKRPVRVVGMKRCCECRRKVARQERRRMSRKAKG